MRELLGALVAAVSALLYVVGYVLEKQALDDLPPLRLSLPGLWRTAKASRRWVAGFSAMIVGLALQVAALTLAPVSVVQPILAGGLIALAAAGPALLGERLSGRHRAALVLVVSAVAAVAVSARGGGNLARDVPGTRFLLMAAAAGGAGVLTAGLALGRGRRAGAGRAGLPGLVGTALAAGLLYGVGAVAEKAVSTELIRHGMVAGALSSLGTAYPWVFLAATLAGMGAFQVGLQAHPASLMASLTNVTSTMCALVGAATVFGEDLLPAGWWSALRVAGLVSVAAAVVLLAGDGAPAAGVGTSEPHRPDHAVAP